LENEPQRLRFLYRIGICFLVTLQTNWEEIPMTAEVNFVRQQGFRDATSEACVYQYPALMWQPRAIGFLVVVGLITQSWAYFLALWALLWWNVVLPRFNPFDALYNHIVAKPKSLPGLGPPPSPRRFAQAMAGTFMLVIGVSLFFGLSILAWAFEALLVAALVALIFGRVCLGSYLFLLFTGQGRFAKRTLPWAHGE
jgi:Domain of unknown function (DUF4395)